MSRALFIQRITDLLAVLMFCIIVPACLCIDLIDGLSYVCGFDPIRRRRIRHTASICFSVLATLYCVHLCTPSLMMLYGWVRVALSDLVKPEKPDQLLTCSAVGSFLGNVHLLQCLSFHLVYVLMDSLIWLLRFLTIHMPIFSIFFLCYALLVA